VLVTGGSDKNLDFSVLVNTAHKTKAIVLLEGSGTNKLKKLLDDAGIDYKGPYDSLEKAAVCALEKAHKIAANIEGERNGCVVALSPGCTSFEMFKNEFDRGNQWKEICLRLS
jgi:UDP-N-acetylmuramoylalanine--D-glutamate ligase